MSHGIIYELGAAVFHAYADSSDVEHNYKGEGKFGVYSGQFVNVHIKGVALARNRETPEVVSVLKYSLVSAATSHNRTRRHRPNMTSFQQSVDAWTWMVLFAQDIYTNIFYSNQKEFQEPEIAAWQIKRAKTKNKNKITKPTPLENAPYSSMRRSKVIWTELSYDQVLKIFSH